MPSHIHSDRELQKTHHQHPPQHHPPRINRNHPQAYSLHLWQLPIIPYAEATQMRHPVSPVFPSASPPSSPDPYSTATATTLHRRAVLPLHAPPLQPTPVAETPSTSPLQVGRRVSRSLHALPQCPKSQRQYISVRSPLLYSLSPSLLPPQSPPPSHHGAIQTPGGPTRHPPTSTSSSNRAQGPRRQARPELPP